MTAHSPITAAAPRARGRLELSLRPGKGAVRIGRLYQGGCLRAWFPRRDVTEMVLTNTAGGITGGDHLSLTIDIGPGVEASATTQAAERIYRALPGAVGRVETRLTIAEGARFNWLPQETILFDGGALRRDLTVDLAPKARALIVEPIVFGRRAMGEVVRSAALSDRITLRRDRAPIYLDRIAMKGDIAAHLARPAVAGGGSAAAQVILADPGAEALLTPLRGLLGAGGGVSLLAPDLLTARLVAEDGFALRRHLIPLIRRMTGTDLPRPWMI